MSSRMARPRSSLVSSTKETGDSPLDYIADSVDAFLTEIGSAIGTNEPMHLGFTFRWVKRYVGADLAVSPSSRRPLTLESCSHGQRALRRRMRLDTTSSSSYRMHSTESTST